VVHSAADSVRLPALPITAIVVTSQELRIALGKEPAPLPEVFAGMIRQHLNNRPKLRTAGGSIGTPWLFPGSRAGKHIATRRRVFRRNPDNTVNLNLPSITLDIHDVELVSRDEKVQP